MEIKDKMVKKGYIPLASNEFIGIAFEGKELKDFWMWTGRYILDSEGNKVKCTVKVESVKEVALHYWKDKWIPVKPISEDFLLEMEDILRNHKGLRRSGHTFPETAFLVMPEGKEKNHD